MSKADRLTFLVLIAGLCLGGCSPANSQDSTNAAASGAKAAPKAAPATPAPVLAPGTVGIPPAYFGPNAVGTGTTASPSSNIPFVDSAASCGSILDAAAHQSCLQSAGRR